PLFFAGCYFPPPPPKKIAERDEVGASRDQRRNVAERRRVSDARDFENLGPPGDAFLDRRQRRGSTLDVRISEHHIVGSLLRGEHGVMPCDKSASAGDA